MTTNYDIICKHPAQLKALTTLTREEFEQLLPFFSEAYAAKYPATHTQAGQVRQRALGGGRPGQLATLADKLLFILRYAKTYPTQTVLGVDYGLSQGQISTWVQTLMPLLQEALRRAGYAPAREAAQLAEQLPPTPVPRLQADGTERRRRRPRNSTARKAHYSGKKKACMDKNVLVTLPRRSRIVFLSRTTPGATHDKRVLDDATLRFSTPVVLETDTAFLGYTAENLHLILPKRAPKGRANSTLDRIANHLKASARVTVEHVMASVKRLHILTDVFRNLTDGLSDMVMEIGCGLHNLRTAFRQPHRIAAEIYFQ